MSSQFGDRVIKRKEKTAERTGEEMIKSYQSSIPHYMVHGGVPFPGALITRRLGDLQTFQMHSDDVIISGYPRSGNHWMKEIVTLLMGEELPVTYDGKHVQERIPLMEMSVDFKICMQTYMDNYFHRCGPFRPMLSKVATKFGLKSSEKSFSHTYSDPLQDLEQRKSPRVMHTHLPLRLLPKDAQQSKCKIIYLIRNGKDVSVSFYEMHKMYPPFGYYSGDWKEFFYAYLTGKVCFGSWFEHVRDWYAHIDEPHILFVKYEDMIEDLPREVGRVAEFLNKKLPEAALADIASRCTFDKMKENPMSTYDGLHDSINTQRTNFLRRGKVADWKSKLTVEESEVFDNMYQAVFKDSEKDPNIRFSLT